MFKATIASVLAITIAAPAIADVNVYSARQPELIQPMIDAYTAETGEQVNVIFAQKGLVERMVAEGKRSPADVYLTADIGKIVAAVDAGVTQPVKSDILEENIPAEFRDSNGMWFAPTTRARITYVSKDRVDPSEITTYEDLADPKWEVKICMRSGLHSYNLALTAAYIAHHGEAATKTWLEGLKANQVRKPQGNDRAQAKAIWAGECDVAIANTYYIGKMVNNPEQADWAAALVPVFPKFEDGGTHLNISGMSLAKYAPNKESAIRFMEFMASDEAQQLYAEQNFEYPVEPGVEASDLVKSWGTFTPDNIALEDVAKYRGDALKLMEEVNFDGGS